MRRPRPPSAQPSDTPERARVAYGRRGHPGIMPGGPSPPEAACDAPVMPSHLHMPLAEIAPALTTAASAHLRDLGRDLLRVQRRSWAPSTRSDRGASIGVRLVSSSARSRTRARPSRVPIVASPPLRPHRWQWWSGVFASGVAPLVDLLLAGRSGCVVGELWAGRPPPRAAQSAGSASRARAHV